MKQCLRCNRTYTDANLNFCLEDGELLVETQSSSSSSGEAPPTVILSEARRTNPTDWTAQQQQSGWQQPQSPVPYKQPQVFGQYAMPKGPNQTMAIVSLSLGIGSVLMICCYGGIWLGLPAAIVGFIAMRNADSNPDNYGGRGLAIGGMALGAVTFLLAIIFLAFGILGSVIK